MQTLAQSSPSAGGAAIGQVVIATAMVSVILGAIAFMLWRHRSGRSTALGTLAERIGEIVGLPHWVGLPSLVLVVSLLSAVFGVYWDVAIHIDEGRDDGPLANLAHYPILFGLIGCLAAGWLSIALPKPGERPGPAAVRLADGWYAPVGGIVIATSAMFGLAGFPLDDVWHRVFGQDVTLWGPTHLMMIGGAVTTLVGQALLLAEGVRSRGSDPSTAANASSAPESGGQTPRVARIAMWIRRVSLGGGLLIAVDVFAMEFDYGVPQFAAVFQPLMLAFGAGLGLVVARRWAGAGGALAAAAFYLLIRGILTVLVGPVLGETTPAMPLFLVEALCVEAVALAMRGRSPLGFGIASGLAVGTLGFAAEWAWSHVVMPIPWQASMLPEGLVFALVGGLVGGTLGALLAGGLRGELPSRRIARIAAIGSLAAFGLLIALGLRTNVPEGEVAVSLTETRAQPREAIVEARFEPPALAEDRPGPTSPPGRAAVSRSRRWRRSPAASGARRIRSHSMASGRRSSASTMATSWRVRRSSCPKIRRSRLRRCRRGRPSRGPWSRRRRSSSASSRTTCRAGPGPPAPASSSPSIWASSRSSPGGSDGWVAPATSPRRRNPGAAARLPPRRRREPDESASPADQRCRPRLGWRFRGRSSGISGGMTRRLEAGILVAVMLVGAFSLWTLVPLGWLWIGSQIVGTQEPRLWAYVVVLVGIVVSVILIAKILSALNRRVLSIRGDEGYRPTKIPLPWLESMRDERHSQRATTLEIVLVSSAVLAGIAMLIWFIGFAGSPVPEV